MWNRYGEPLTLAEIAASAMFSKFYFSRIFRSATGISPGRFLSVIRLHQAKKRLLETSLNVTDISYEVGYASLGTFTTRFTRSVGIAPSRYRTLSHTGIPLPPVVPVGASHHVGSAFGSLNLPLCGAPMRVYVGAFSTPIPEGVPVACDILDGEGFYRLDRLPTGTWFIRAIGVAYKDLDPRPWKRRPQFIGEPEAVTVRAGQGMRVDIGMRPSSPFDLPVLMAIPELDGVCVEHQKPLVQVMPLDQPEADAEAQVPELVPSVGWSRWER
jgi:AraC family transcriptional regulator